MSKAIPQSAVVVAATPHVRHTIPRSRLKTVFSLTSSARTSSARTSSPGPSRQARLSWNDSVPLLPLRLSLSVAIFRIWRETRDEASAPRGSLFFHRSAERINMGRPWAGDGKSVSSGRLRLVGRGFASATAQ